ncbi:MAG: hydrogenase maturation protease [Actinomycetota bacterium]
MTLSVDDARRIALDDSLSAHPNGQTVVVGCGNLLRGDDAVGPILIRHLWEEGVPDSVTIVDGGTAGMDVAFKMRGARRVVIVDAAATGAEPGTIYRVPGEELEDLPSLDGLHMHQFRWDHALSFGRWLLGDDYPDDITVFLIEIESTEPGASLTERVETSMHDVKSLVRDMLDVPTEPAGPAEAPTVEFTADGSLRLGADLAARHFPTDALVATTRGDELWLLPLIGPENGGLLLKQRNAAGDRSTLIWEALPDGVQPVGERPAIWDDQQGALRIAIGA